MKLILVGGSFVWDNGLNIDGENHGDESCLVPCSCGVGRARIEELLDANGQINITRHRINLKLHIALNPWLGMLGTIDEHDILLGKSGEDELG